MCERCRVIKRHGRTIVICSNPGTSKGRAEPHGTHRRRQPSDAEAARDRPDVHLRDRPSTSQKIIKALELDPEQKVRDLTDEEVTKLRNYIDSELEVEGDLGAIAARRSSA